MQFNVTSSPLPLLQRMRQDLIDLFPFKEKAEEAFKTAKKVDLNIGTVEDGLANQKQILQDQINALETFKSKTTGDIGSIVSRTDDIEFNRLKKLNDQYGTLDYKLIDTQKALAAEEVRARAEHAIAQKAAAAAAAKADESLGLIGDVRKTAATALDTAKDAGGKAFTALGQAADLFDKVANIFNFLLTVGTAIRMEQIAANSKERDADLQQQINDYVRTIQDLINGLRDANGRISINVNDIEGILDQMSGFQNGINAILQNTSSILSGQNSLSQSMSTISSQQQQLAGKTDELMRESDELLRESDYQIQLTKDVPQNVLNGTKEKVCEALRDPYCNDGLGGNDCDLQPVLDAINEVKEDTGALIQAVGTFPYNCTTPQPNDGYFTTISEAMQTLTCSLTGSGKSRLQEISEAIEDLQKDSEKLLSSSSLTLACASFNSQQLSFESDNYIKAASLRIAAIFELPDEGNEYNSILAADYDRENKDWLDSSNLISGSTNLYYLLGKQHYINGVSIDILNAKLSLLMNALKLQGLSGKDFYALFPVEIPTDRGLGTGLGGFISEALDLPTGTSSGSGDDGGYTGTPIGDVTPIGGGTPINPPTGTGSGGSSGNGTAPEIATNISIAAIPKTDTEIGSGLKTDIDTPIKDLLKAAVVAREAEWKEGLLDNEAPETLQTANPYEMLD